MARGVEAAVAALRAGEPVVLPTDTVYGLCASPFEEGPVRRMVRLKGRDDLQPTALLAASVEGLIGLRAGAPPSRVLRALLPGAVHARPPEPGAPVPAGSAGRRRSAIGVRVPELPAETRAVVDAIGAVAATSANLHGGPDPRRLEDVPESFWTPCGAASTAASCRGTPSTVLDLTGRRAGGPPRGRGARGRGARTGGGF